MKAVRFDRYGGIEVLQVANVPMPEPSYGEALVKVWVGVRLLPKIAVWATMITQDGVETWKR